eukprot:CAMPEP_0185605094 /NCGR_PEP_ID=MMETSP0436-20130131/3781_1 /TAXON_ID=626734 ORGANISM="Favella taraikaensis, Strain Fe Narragansett Bay" /NCGR_SAMPLE_ID=MMETSP0436 /ASSEMBLY_ACC=CAM_ASM_000390 /LENGTH=384 /DNA_ID=CAMNT_0028236165 /DNA_START=52 /DNA_END=1202 /DNA_ORIENTATION=+
MTCPPNTAMPGPCGVPPVTLGCNQGGGAQAQTVHGTAATLCTRIPACDQPIQTWFHTCGVPPVTLTCNQGAGAQAQAQNHNTILGPTGWQGCQPTAYPGCQGQTGYVQCAHTLATVCTSPGFCTGGAGAQVQDTNTILGPTAYQGCQGQTGYNECAHTYATVCTSPGFCPDGSGAQAQNVGPTGTQGCTMPPHCLGQTAWLTCPQAPNTHLMGCTTVTAAPDNSGAQAQAAGLTAPDGTCTIVPPVTYYCKGGAQAQTIGNTAYQGCPGQTGYDACGHTLATVCTQIACDQGSHTAVLGCTTVTSPPETVACQGGAQAQNVGNTGWETCVQTAPPACYGQTGTQGCTMPPNCYGQTSWLTCTQGGAGAQVQDTNTILGPTAYQG